jgi:endo-beta-N-acetylglucosaminidase D
LLSRLPLFAQIINTAPYILTVDELKQWTSSGPTASTDLIATVNLAPRFTNAATQFNPALSNDMKIAYLPDGMNNFGNYFGEQSQFNLYNFTHWAYIDKLVWFGGTASQTVQLPSSPWVNAAHKNGVKVFGNVFFAPTVFGGSTATLTNFLEQDGGGNFIAVPKMMAIMHYYNFDGW